MTIYIIYITLYNFITIYITLYHFISIYINLYHFIVFYVCYIHTANARHALKQAGMKSFSQSGMHSEEWAASGTELPVDFEVGESSAARGFAPTALARSCFTVHSHASVRADRHEFSQACMHAHRHSHSQAGFRQACSRPFPLDHIYLPPQGLSQRLLSPPQGLSQRLLSRNHVFITIYSHL